MEYRNTKNGAVIDIKGELKDRDWEPVSAPEPVQEEPKKKKTAPRKKE